MPEALTLEPRAILPEALRYPGLTVTERRDLTLLSVMADPPPVDAPTRPAWRSGWIATGPGRWLVARRETPASLLAELEQAHPGAALVDLSDAYACFSLRGPALREVLAKGVTLDLYAFIPGSAAVTAIAGIGVILWCEDDAAAIELAVTRSYTASFLHWLEVSSPAGSAPS